MREHDGGNANQAHGLWCNLLREGVDHWGDLIGLVDALGQARASSFREEAEGHAQDVAEGGLDNFRLHFTGGFGADVIAAEREEVPGNGEDEHAGDGP